MRALASFCSARSPSSSGSSARRRRSSSITSSSARAVVLAAAGERGAHAVGVLADALEVEHAASAASAAYLSDSVMFVAGTCWASRPEYFARNSATACACSPTTMFCGMIAPEKPPLRIA